MEEVIIFLKEIKNILVEIFQSGFISIHDETLKQLESYIGLGEQYGLIYCCNLIKNLKDGIEKQRHIIEKDIKNLMEIYCNLNKYINLALEKTQIDEAKKELYL